MSTLRKIKVRDGDRVRHEEYGDGTVIGDNTYDQNTYGIALIRYDSGENHGFTSTYELTRIRTTGDKTT